jgi:hypothetical protein
MPEESIEDLLPLTEEEKLEEEHAIQDEELAGQTENIASISKPNNTLVIDGKDYHKASVIATRLTSKRACKVTMRTLRARGVTVEDLRQSKHDELNSVDLANTDLVKAGDIASILVRTEDQICQAVIEILCFEKGDAKKQLTSVGIDDLEDHDAKITVQCQILKVVPSKSSTTKPVNWQWTGEYIRFGAKNLLERSTSRQFVLRVPGKLVHPLHHQL